MTLKNSEFRNIAPSSIRVGAGSRTFEPRALETSRRIRGIVRAHRSSLANKCAANGTSYFVCAKYLSVHQRSFDTQISDQIPQVRRDILLALSTSRSKLVSALARSFGLRHIGVTTFEIIEITATRTHNNFGWLFSCIVPRRQYTYDLFGDFNRSICNNLLFLHIFFGSLAPK